MELLSPLYYSNNIYCLQYIYIYIKLSKAETIIIADYECEENFRFSMLDIKSWLKNDKDSVSILSAKSNRVKINPIRFFFQADV